MINYRVLLRLLLASVLLLWGCASPPVGPSAGAVATLRVSLAPFGSSYQLSYVRLPDWRRAEATLTRPGGAVATAGATRGGTLSFGDLVAGSGYALTVRLFRPTPEGVEAEVAVLSRPSLTLVGGANVLTAGDFTATHPTPAVGGTDALGMPFVASWPADGPGAMFRHPDGLAVDASGTVYVADNGNFRLRAITPDGLVSTLAGNGTDGWADGTGSGAIFSQLRGVAVDASGMIYVTDGNRIRKVTPGGTTSNLAGDTWGGWDGYGARFWGPGPVAVDASGTVYVGESYRVRKIQPDGFVSTLAGPTIGNPTGYVDAAGTSARFSGCAGLAVDASGTVYVADTGNHCIRKITADGNVSTLAGDGVSGYVDGAGSGARFSQPRDVVLDASSGSLYVADGGNRRLRKVTLAGVVSTLAGDGTSGYVDGAAASARFVGPGRLALDRHGVLYVNDDHRIRKVTPDGVVSTFAGMGFQGYLDGWGHVAPFYQPAGVAVGADGAAYVGDSGRQRIVRIAPDGSVSTLAGSGLSGSADGPGSTASFTGPRCLAVDGQGVVYVADGGRIRTVGPDGLVSTLAGDGTAGFADGAGSAARFRWPQGGVVDASGNLFVADTGNHRIRRITPAGVVSSLAGDGSAGYFEGPAALAQFNNPVALALDAAGTLLVADRDNRRIRTVSTNGVVGTLAGDGNDGYADGPAGAAQFRAPAGVAVDAAGDVYVSDRGNHRIRKITAGGVVSTVAGDGTAGFANGLGREARFWSPEGLALDASGAIYVVDTANHWVRRIR